MKLYHYAYSGHAHRARLFLCLIGVTFEIVEIDPRRGEHQTPAFLEFNPFGQVPVLDDAGVIVSDSTAILVYLAKKFGKTSWLPDDAAGAAEVQRWLSVAAGEIAYGPCAARLITVFGAAFDPAEVIARAHRVLGLIDQRLAGRDWIACAQPTIADVALYSYIAQAPEGNVDIRPYTRIADWLARVETLPGFVPFPQTVAGLRTAIA